MPIALVAVAASVAAGAMQADAARKTANKNRDAQSAANELNYLQFKESRGSGGSAVLPEYMPAGSEAALAQSALDTSNAINSIPMADRIAQYNAILQAAQPTIDAGNATIGNIYNGAMQDQLLAQADPVFAARTNAANVNAQGINVGMNQALNQMAAQEAAKGYVGNGSYANNRMAGAYIGAAQQAAAQKAGVDLQNAAQKQAIQNQMLDLQLKSLDMPVNRANQLIALSQAPYQGAATMSKLSQSPLEFFRIGVGNPPNNVAPQLAQTPSIGGVVASGIGQAAGAYNNYQQQKELANMWASMNQPKYTGVNTGGTTSDWANNWGMMSGTGA
jgi:hypothetical protein